MSNKKKIAAGVVVIIAIIAIVVIPFIVSDNPCTPSVTLEGVVTKKEIIPGTVVPLITGPKFMVYIKFETAESSINVGNKERYDQFSEGDKVASQYAVCEGRPTIKTIDRK